MLDLEGWYMCGPWLVCQVGWVWWPFSIGCKLRFGQVRGLSSLGGQEIGQEVGPCEWVGAMGGLESWGQNYVQVPIPGDWSEH